MREYLVVIERDEDGWFVGHVPSLPGCHTQGKSEDELMERMKEAIAVYLESSDAPEEERFVDVRRIAV